MRNLGEQGEAVITLEELEGMFARMRADAPFDVDGEYRKTYFLHVEKVEKHTPKSLDKRNRQFYELAERFDIESYDGMDVGPV